MKNAFLTIDKISTVIVLIMLAVNILPSMDIPLVACFIPLIVIGMFRGLSVALLLFINMISYINENIKAYRLKNKN